jgi:hypothetical protein
MKRKKGRNVKLKENEQGNDNPLFLLVVLFECATTFGFAFTGAMMATGAEWYVWLPLLIVSYIIFKIAIFLHKIY